MTIHHISLDTNELAAQAASEERAEARRLARCKSRIPRAVHPGSRDHWSERAVIFAGLPPSTKLGGSIRSNRDGTLSHSLGDNAVHADAMRKIPETSGAFMAV